MNTSSLGVALKNPVIRRPKWWFIDAEGQRVGRLATQIATLLQGKYKPIYAPAVDVGDFVVLVNADKVEFTGHKWKKKMVRWHTGFPGGLRVRPAGEYHKDFPDRIIQKAIVGMLPKNNLYEVRQSRLKVFAGPNHTHHAQNPVPYSLHKTRPEDLNAPWGLVPEFKVTFTKQGSGEEGPSWVLQTEEPRITKIDRSKMKHLKRDGKLGNASKKELHPDGFVRGGFLRPGVTKY